MEKALHYKFKDFTYENYGRVLTMREYLSLDKLPINPKLGYLSLEKLLEYVLKKEGQMDLD